MVERDGRITGYATGIGWFSHAVAESNDDLKPSPDGAQLVFEVEDFDQAVQHLEEHWVPFAMEPFDLLT